MNINIQPKQSSMSASTVSAMITLTTEETVVNTLAIPKGDAHEWENKEVRFFNKRWKIFGIPLEGIEDLIPLEWNKKVMVERYE